MTTKAPAEELPGSGPPAGRRRVLCLSPYPPSGPSVRHRISAYAPFWAEQGIDLTVAAFMTDRFYRIRREFGWRRGAEKLFWFAICTLRLLRTMMRLRGFDAVIIHREVFPLGPPLFERLAARLNPAVVYDIDDALWHPPSNAVNQRALLWDPKRVPKILAVSRHVVAGNSHVRDYAAVRHRRVSLVPTSYDDLGGRARVADVPVIVWIGNTGNAWYARFVVAILERIARSRPVVLRLIGGADIDDVRSDTLTIDRRRWSAIEERGLTEADIGIMPLPDLAFERGKSGFKIIQYWSAGLGVVASPVGPNAELIRDGVDGLLATTEAEWETALSRLLADAAFRATLGRGGYARYLSGFSRRENAHRWVDILAEAIAPDRAR